MTSKLLKLNGGRCWVRTSDPYDVNVVPSAELAESCGFYNPLSGICGIRFTLRSDFLAQLNQCTLSQSQNYQTCLSTRSLSGGS